MWESMQFNVFRLFGDGISETTVKEPSSWRGDSPTDEILTRDEIKAGLLNPIGNVLKKDF
jgi:hypothetical protein